VQRTSSVPASETCAGAGHVGAPPLRRTTSWYRRLAVEGRARGVVMPVEARCLPRQPAADPIRPGALLQGPFVRTHVRHKPGEHQCRKCPAAGKVVTAVRDVEFDGEPAAERASAGQLYAAVPSASNPDHLPCCPNQRASLKANRSVAQPTSRHAMSGSQPRRFTAGAWWVAILTSARIRKPAPLRPPPPRSNVIRHGRPPSASGESRGSVDGVCPATETSPLTPTHSLRRGRVRGRPPRFHGPDRLEIVAHDRPGVACAAPPR